MKIQNEQLQALQQQAEAKKARPREEGAFDAILSGELGAAGAAGQALSGRPAPGAGALFGVTGAAPLEDVTQTAETAVLTTVAESINSMLGELDEYAETLAAPQGADLRKAYGLLQGMDRDLAALRETAPDLATRHAGMAALVDEISVITRAETVKLNRGDYL